MQTKTDAELLKAYVDTNDESAFAELVTRHGDMVYRVSFRKLVNRHDAEDASQAVFMALIKKASTLMKREGTLAGWLHLAARNAALFIARKRARQGLRESSARESLYAYHQPEANVQDRETVLLHLDDELASLTAVQHEAVILRYLDGLSEKDAALAAGCAPHTLTWRASNGISNLRKRLVKRGCVLGVPALIGVLATESQAAVPETLIPSLLAVPKLAAAGAAAGTASANIIFLMEGALKTMAIAKIKTAGIGILIALLIGTTGVMAVKEIQKRQAPGANDKSEIVASPSKQEVHEQPKSSKLETKDKTRSAKGKKPPRARNYQAELEQTMEDLIAGRGDEERLLAAGNAFHDWLSVNYEEAVSWATQTKIDKKYNNLLGMIRNTGIPNFLLELADSDPASAAQRLLLLELSLHDDPMYMPRLPDLVKKWAENDPVAAAKWAQQLEKDSDSLITLAEGWAVNDPAAAAQWVQQLSDTGTATNAAIKVVEKWNEKDPTAAAQWAIQLPDTLREARHNCLLRALEKWAEDDFTAASNWVQQMPSGKERDSSLLGLAQYSVKGDPAAAAQWALQLPEENSSLRFSALGTVVRGWADTDPAAAAQWALSLPDEHLQGGMFDIVSFRVFSGPASNKDPSAVAQSVEKLPEGKFRLMLLSKVAHSWDKKNPAAAKAWVKQLSIPENMKDKILKEMVENSWSNTDWVR